MIEFSNVKVIDVDSLDGLVIETYGRPYNFQQQDGCKERQYVDITVPDDAYDYENDSISEMIGGSGMGVSFAAWLACDPKELQDHMFWERNFYPGLQMIANDLHSKGLWPADNYKINIDW